MNLDEAKELLSKCTRDELRDHAFGDSEVSWVSDEFEVASGYFGGGTATVGVYEGENTTTFSGDEARELRKLGSEDNIERNDATGPDEYKEGITLPGLTLEGVLKEITTRPGAV